MNRDGPIGIFDSGVGGLSVWREVVRELPLEDTLVFADQAHVPYGPRPTDEIRALTLRSAQYLRARGCKALVVACNTASAAALKLLRDGFPDWPVIGMEPAIKPAAALTRSGTIGVMATSATFQGRLFQATAGRYAQGVKLIEQICEGLVERVEAGDFDDLATDTLLEHLLTPMLAAGADVIVLACTHYPFLLDAIRRVVGPDVAVLDPAPAVARYLRTVLNERELGTHRSRPARHRFVTSGEPQRFARIVARLIGERGSVTCAPWTASDEVAFDETAEPVSR
jgi:glutamate racemase